MGFDAFISYSHAADGLLAPRLQDGLQRFAKPWWRRRSLHVFRDETGLSANPGLWSSIADAMEDAEFFVLLASPEAAGSVWVNREIDYWKTNKDPTHILPVVTDGEWAWDDTAGGFAAASTAVPLALAGVFAEEPRHIDMRWARFDDQLDLRNGRFRDQVAELAAPIHGLAKDDLAGLDVYQHRRTLRHAWGAAIALLILTVLAGFTALVAASNAASARAAQHRADASAQQARASADEANRQKGNAQANAAVATRQQQAAEASAEQARLSKDEADRSAADALMQQQAADAANVLLTQANTNLDQANDDLATTNGYLATANSNLANANNNLTNANDLLSAANDNLDADRLVASAEAERLKGNLDTAMLLANEAIDIAADKTKARNEAVALQEDSLYLERYLPGPATFGPLIAGPGRVAQISAATPAILVRDLAQPDVPRTIDTSALGDPLLTAFNADGTRLIVVFQQPATTVVGVWDTTAPERGPLWSGATRSWELSPDLRTLAVGENTGGPEPAVVLVRLQDGSIETQWTGHLLTEYSCIGRSYIGRPDVPQLDSGCAFSSDGRRVLGWSDALGKFVVWDRDRPQQTTALYTPTGFDINALPVKPRFVAGGLVVGLTDPRTVTAYAEDGTVVASHELDRDVTSLRTTPDGSSIIVADVGYTTTRLDVPALSATPLGTVPADCAKAVAPSVEVSPRGQWAKLLTGCGEWWLRVDQPRDPVGGEGFLAFDPLTVARDTDGVEHFALDSFGQVLDLTTGVTFSLSDRLCVPSPDGRFVVCGNLVVYLDNFKLQPAQPRPVLGTGLRALAVAPDGSKIYGLTEQVRTWVADPSRSGPGEAGGSFKFAFAPDDGGRPPFAIVSPSGRRVLVGNSKGAEIHNLDTGEIIPIAMPDTNFIFRTPFFAGDDRVVYPIADPTGPLFMGFVFDANAGVPLNDGLLNGVVSASGDGSVLALNVRYGITGNFITLLSSNSLQLIRNVVPHDFSLPFGPLTVNHDGSMVAVWDGGDLVLIDTTTGEVHRLRNVYWPPQLQGQTSGPTQLAFSPDGTKIAATMSLGYALDVGVIDIASGTLQAEQLAVPSSCSVPEDILPPVVLPDGSVLLSTGQLIDERTLTAIGPQLGCGSASWGSATLINDGTAVEYTMQTVDGDQATVDVYSQPLAPNEVHFAACNLAGRNLTQGEWARYEPNSAYHKTCDQWPPGT